MNKFRYTVSVLIIFTIILSGVSIQGFRDIEFHALDAHSAPGGTNGSAPLQGSDPHVHWTTFPSPDPSTLYTDTKIADFNNDGNLDVIGLNGPDMNIWTGDGTGNWIPFSGTPTSADKNGVDVGDYNNDGKPDIIVATEDGIFAYRGNGMGSWVSGSSGLPSTGVFHDVALGEELAERDLYTVKKHEFDMTGNLFAIGVESASPEIRVGDEVCIVNGDKLTATGTAKMNADEMVESEKGEAVKVRHHRKQSGK